MDRRDLGRQAGLLAAFSDETRLRLLALLEGEELSVAELTSATELGQSKVSTHLSRLREQGLVVDRKLGTSAFYRLDPRGAAGTSGTLWSAIRASLEDDLLARDRERARRAVEAREKPWPERMAGELERHYSPGRTWQSLAQAFTGLVRLGEVLDVGAGDGTVAELLCARSRRYVCLERSPTLVEAAQARLAQQSHVEVLEGDMHALPFAKAAFDQVLLLNVLTFADKPERALDEAARVLRPQGELVLVTLARHRHMDVAASFGHLKAGFTVKQLETGLAARGLAVERAEITARERKRPHFEVITCFARKKS